MLRMRITNIEVVNSLEKTESFRSLGFWTRTKSFHFPKVVVYH